VAPGTGVGAVEAHYLAGSSDSAGLPPLIRRAPAEAASQALAPPAAPPDPPELDVAAVTEQVYQLLVRRLADERERRGW
jgi:hypothetical protein